MPAEPPRWGLTSGAEVLPRRTTPSLAPTCPTGRRSRRHIAITSDQKTVTSRQCHGGAWRFFPTTSPHAPPSHSTPTKPHAPRFTPSPVTPPLPPPSLYRPFLAPLPCPHPIPEEHTAIPPSPLTPSPEWVPGSCISPTGDDNYLAPPHLGPRLLFFPPQPTSRQSINPTKSTRRICSFTTNRNHSS